MNSNFLSSVKTADVNTHWFGVEQNEEGEERLVQTKKTLSNRLGWGLVYLITLGFYDREKEGIKQVAYKISAIMDDFELNKADPTEYQLLKKSINALSFNGKFLDLPSDLVDRLATFKKLKDNLKKPTDIYREKESLDSVLKIYEQFENQSKANNFFLTSDDKEKNVLHDFFGTKQNLQIETITPLFQALPPEVLKISLLHKNAKGETPLGIAIASGQMAIISKIFPLPPNENSIKFTETEKLAIAEEVKNLILLFSDLAKQKEHLKQCPGANNYDKQNHILSALQRLVSYEFDLSISLNEIPKEDLLHIPKDFRLLVENSPISASFLKMHHDLCKECTSLTTAPAISKKMDEWQYEPPLLVPTNSSINYRTALNIDPNNKLFGLIEKCLTSKELKDKNSYLNYLRLLLDPFEAYDQKIDFTDACYNNILHKIVDVAIQNQNLDIEADIQPIISQLVYKYPDFLEKKDGNNQDILEYLRGKKEVDSSNLKVLDAIEKIINEIQKDLNTVQFVNQTKKSLKYYLEDRGRELNKTVVF